MAKAWLNDIGLPQYSQAFQSHLVDGRMLNSLMKRDLEKHLNVSKKFHQVSILLGIELLYQVNFSREVRTGGQGGHSPAPAVCPSNPLSMHLRVHPPIHPSAHPFTHLSFHASFLPFFLPPTNTCWALVRPCAKFRENGEPSFSKNSLLIRKNHKEAGGHETMEKCPNEGSPGFYENPEKLPGGSGAGAEGGGSLEIVTAKLSPEGGIPGIDQWQVCEGVKPSRGKSTAKGREDRPEATEVPVLGLRCGSHWGSQVSNQGTVGHVTVGL